MSVYIGTCNYGVDEAETSELSNPSEIDGDLDMKNKRMVNLKHFGESTTDAATVGIVLDWVGALDNAKVDWGGGTMTGDMIMGGNKIQKTIKMLLTQDIL